MLNKLTLPVDLTHKSRNTFEQYKKQNQTNSAGDPHMNEIINQQNRKQCVDRSTCVLKHVFGLDAWCLSHLWKQNWWCRRHTCSKDPHMYLLELCLISCVCGNKIGDAANAFSSCFFSNRLLECIFPSRTVCGNKMNDAENVFDFVSRCYCLFNPVVMAGNREAIFPCFPLCFWCCVVLFKPNC